jgi:hypothetical protein
MLPLYQIYKNKPSCLGLFCSLTGVQVGSIAAARRQLLHGLLRGAAWGNDAGPFF